MKKAILLLTSVIFFFAFSKAFAINPDREYFMTPDSVSWNYEQLKIKTKDNYKLNTWIYEANSENKKDTVIILAYPDAGNMSYFVYYAAILANEGYTVVTFDYRGFGKSDDFEIQREYLYYTEFALDLEAVVDDISKKFKYQHIGIWGMSMGTAIASRAYPSIKGKIDFIIGEGFVTDTSILIDRYKELEKELLLPEESRIYEKAIQSIKSPVLIMTASNDEITTHQDALKLQEILGQSCEVIQYEGNHLSGFQLDAENLGFGTWYVEQINSFLEKI